MKKLLKIFIILILCGFALNVYADEQDTKKEQKLEKAVIRLLKRAEYDLIENLSKTEKTVLGILLKLLKHQGPNIRKNACWALTKFQDQSKIVVPELLKMTEDKNLYVRICGAMHALSEFKDHETTAAKFLAKELTHKNPSARYHAIDIIGWLHNKVPEITVPALIQALKDTNADIRAISAATLGIIEKKPEITIPALITAATDPDPNVRKKVCWSLGKFDESPDTAKALLKMLNDKDADIRIEAAEALGNSKTHKKTAVLTLIKNLKHKDVNVRANAANALGSIEKEPEITIPALIQALKDPEPSVREKACWALGEFDKNPDVITNALLTMLKDKDPLVRKEAADALSKFEKHKHTAVNLLIKNLKHKDLDVRLSTAITIAWMDNDTAAAAIPALIQSLKDPEPSMREQAVSALRMIPRRLDISVPALINALNDSDTDVRKQVIWALANPDFKEKSSDIIPALKKLLKDKDPDIRANTRDALYEITHNTEYLTSYAKNKDLEHINTLIKQKKYTQAIKALKQAIDRDPKDQTAYYNLAGIYVSLQKYNQAHLYYNRSIAINPEHTLSLFNRGSVHMKLGNFKQAIADYSKAISVSKKPYPVFYFCRGNAYFNTKQFDKAMRDYGRTIKLSPKYAPAYANRADIYYLRKDYIKAANDYFTAHKYNDKILKTYPCVIEAFVQSAKIYKSKGKYKQARQELTRALKISPNNKCVKKMLRQFSIKSSRNTNTVKPMYADIRSGCLKGNFDRI